MKGLIKQSEYKIQNWTKWIQNTYLGSDLEFSLIAVIFLDNASNSSTDFFLIPFLFHCGEKKSVWRIKQKNTAGDIKVQWVYPPHLQGTGVPGGSWCANIDLSAWTLWNCDKYLLEDLLSSGNLFMQKIREPGSAFSFRDSNLWIKWDFSAFKNT